MKFYKHILLLPVLMLSVLLSSCEDRFDYSSQIIGEGESLVQATLEFKPSVTTLGGSRTAGNEISNIEKLAIVIYDMDGNLIDVYNNIAFKPLDSTKDKPSDYPTGPNGEDISSDNATAKVQCEMKLPYGRYRMYAVANLERNLSKDDEDIQSIAGLKAIKCEWDPNDISKNAQMFGYFTNDVTTGNTAFTETDPAVTVNQKSVALHSWIKRLASKVTVAFDGSGLHQGIVVYIHNVSIRQIPLTCTLGEGNQPKAEDQVTPAAFNESVTNSNQALYYSKKDNNKGEPVAPSPYDITKYKNWLEVANGSGPNSDGLVGSDHGVDSPALFFYENMQGVHADKPKEQQKSQVGTNVAPFDKLKDEEYKDYTDKDYKDGVEWGTFIEVEAYYQCDTVPTSNGPIRYRFMLGQNTSDNYNAIRNHHYKLTLGFRGYANQPDWHIEYKEERPEVYAPEVYVPYTYNTSVQLPMRFNGNLTALRAEIIENSWAPYDENGEYEVPPLDRYGGTDFDNRTLEFAWSRNVYVNGSGPALAYNNDGSPSNAADNYVYGRHRTNYYHLDEKGNDIISQPYYVSPIWAGFFRLMQPTAFVDVSGSSMDAVLLDNTGQSGSDNYGSTAVRKAFMDYFYGNYGGGRGSAANSIPLNQRTFDIANPQADQYNRGNNAYTVEKGTDATGQEYTTVTMNIWTQPKSMCGISGFSGNNPYEDYNRKGVIRFYATFNTADGPTTIRKDVTVIQAKRLVNPKAVWRRHDNPQDFNVTLLERDLTDITRVKFQPVVSRGEWSATIKAGDTDFFSLVAQGSSTGGGKEVTGKTLSEIKFLIDFNGPIGYTESKCAIIEVRYHNKTCVHNIFVRQGYHQPMRITNNGPQWSSYNVYSCAPGTTPNLQTETRDGAVVATLTRNPLSFGAFFKKGNYAQGISVSNIDNYGPLAPPGANVQFALTGTTNPVQYATWDEISGNTTNNTNAWHWANFGVTLNYTEDGEDKTEHRTYRVPTIDDFNTLLNTDFGVGVMYGDGATAPARTTTAAFGFLDPDNSVTDYPYGMRGFICYNSENAHQIFFPIGTSGIGRRTIQDTETEAERGTLRYSSYDGYLTGTTNAMRPIAMNMKNAPGSIYWIYRRTSTAATASSGWDMNYFDLNFNSITPAFTSLTTNGGGGDALPIRLVLDERRY
ncbi:MAG: hypothetical protein K2M11_01500 [Paramuribaculum sp.]|nr:hypothetical protein [Paramuribaculum sp.]